MPATMGQARTTGDLLVTVTDQQKNYAEKVFEELLAGGWRVELDGRNEKLGYKIREAQMAKIPYAVVMGDREMKDQTVSPRRRGGKTLKPMSVKEFVELLGQEVSGELRGEDLTVGAGD